MQEEEGDRRYHVVITAQGTATHWQARVHYYWYKKVLLMQCQHAAYLHVMYRAMSQHLQDCLLKGLPAVPDIDLLHVAADMSILLCSRLFRFVLVCPAPFCSNLVADTQKRMLPSNIANTPLYSDFNTC